MLRQPWIMTEHLFREDYGSCGWIGFKIFQVTSDKFIQAGRNIRNLVNFMEYLGKMIIKISDNRT